MKCSSVAWIFIAFLFPLRLCHSRRGKSRSVTILLNSFLFTFLDTSHWKTKNVIDENTVKKNRLVFCLAIVSAALCNFPDSPYFCSCRACERGCTSITSGGARWKLHYYNFGNAASGNEGMCVSVCLCVGMRCSLPAISPLTASDPSIAEVPILRPPGAETPVFYRVKVRSAAPLADQWQGVLLFTYGG
ncbi:hypothetical protein E2C01_046145 [Portunus trituberculatus]|uniref:Secreted protein n=1 Tax=Portunus trituberculatus TaxID=210409 RepID=A0A5B7FXN4_PORTR|nr:hypothetical protein [Portunus trituberculatus]